MQEIILKGIKYTNIPNKKSGTKVATMLTLSNIGLSQSVIDYINSNAFYSLINSIDIDWNGIQLDEGIYINDTSDLINWIKSIEKAHKDKEYDSEHFSGLGRKTLLLKNESNILTQEDFNQENTIYVISNDFDLGGESVTIPEGCLLEFDGGSISNGTLVGNDTAIETGLTKIFGKEVTLDGSWKVKEGYPEWFGYVPDDITKDVTPIVHKFVNVSIPIFFSTGTWYLSECLLNGRKNVSIRGTSTHYNIGTTFKAFNSTSQRFILKLGGLADFGKPSDYYESWCSNFILDGINFDTNNTSFINANSNQGLYKAAVCFDFCVEGYINIRTTGSCPGVFIANTWEVYFESITCYGSYTSINESAVYFGKAYTDVVASNISAVTINNLFGENIYGKFVDCNSSSNIADIIINNIEFEPHTGNANIVSHSGQDASTIIENNIRNIDILYYFNFYGSVVNIGSITYFYKDVLYDNDSIARGLIKVSGLGTNVTVDKLWTSMFTCSTILGATNGAELSIAEINSERYSGTSFVYTLTGEYTDFSNAYNGLSRFTGTINIDKCDCIIDKDLVKVYNPGLIFNRNNVHEVCPLKTSYYTNVLIMGRLNNVQIPLIYFFNVTLSRKFKFLGDKLKFKYIGPNKYDTENIVVTYYEDDSIKHTDNIKLPYSDTQILTYEYTVYEESYDYCTIRFKYGICIDSVELISSQSIEEDLKDEAVLNGGEISDEVINIMSHYSRDDVYKRTALQYFFNSIGTIKNKLRTLILPIFANNINEAIYNVISGTLFTNIDGGNYLEFNKSTRRVHPSVQVSEADWRKTSYELYDAGDFEGGLTIISASDGLGGTDFKGSAMYGCVVRLNSASWGHFVPSTTNNTKIIGCGVVDDNGSSKYIRLGDTASSDRLTGFTTLQDGWDRISQIFGQKPDDNTKGIRILICSDQLLTVEEAKILRDAVINLDNKFAALDEVNDNFTSSMEELLISKSGTFDNKPSSSDISVGFAYFCTDKQTVEGAANGITIYYKGQDTTNPNNSVDIWVDALGRVVS